MKLLYEEKYMGHKIEVYGKYNAVGNVQLVSFLDNERFDSTIVRKPSLSIFKRTTWKEKAEIKINDLVCDAKYWINSKKREEEITNGLLDSLDEL